jgi:hypothetical protein
VVYTSGIIFEYSFEEVREGLAGWNVMVEEGIGIFFGSECQFVMI